MNILWLATVYFATQVYPKLRSAWYSELDSLEREDQAEYQRFQEGLVSFFKQNLNTNPMNGFEKL